MKESWMDYPQNLDWIYNLVTDAEPLREEFGRYFCNYCIKSTNFRSKPNILRFAKSIEHVLDITTGRKARILDAGCGYGVVPIFLGLLGAGEVWGIDQDEYEINVFNKLLGKMNPPLLNVHPIKGDALQLDRYFEEDYFDVVIARETISHMRDTDEFISQVLKALKAHGTFYIRDSNNALDLRGNFKHRKHWKRVEEGPVDPNERPPYNVPYREIRRKLIEDRFPDFDQAEKLAEKTAGLWGDEIHKAVEDYINYGKTPNKPSHVPRHPINGAFCELEFNPYALKAKLIKLGFKVKVAPPYFPPSSRITKMAALILRKFHPLSLFMVPSYEIVARKEA